MIKISHYNFTPNYFEVYQDYAIIYLKSYKYGTQKCLVDLEDLERVLSFGRWSYNTSITGYFTVRCRSKSVILSRFIFNAHKEFLVDHINQNTLDCRKANLRLCNNSENRQNLNAYKNNTTGIKGLYYKKQTGKWNPTISYNGKNIHLGYYSDKETATNVAKLSRAYLYPFSPEARTVNKNDIPQWIKNKIDQKCKNII